MLPVKTARVGCFTYTISVHDEGVSENHGDTCLEKKHINLFDNGNEEVLKETLLHEFLHVLLEDVLRTVKEIENPSEQEEQLIRILSPRLMQWGLDNPELVDFIWGDEEEGDEDEDSNAEGGL